MPTILKAGGSFSFGPNDKSVKITIGADVTVYRGATLVIRCPVESAYDTMVFWTNINGRPVTIGKAAQVGNDIVISDIDERYAITFICTAKTRRGQDNARSTVFVKGILNFDISFRVSFSLSIISFTINDHSKSGHVTIILRGRAGYEMIDNQQGT